MNRRNGLLPPVNLVKHGIAFQTARLIFADPGCVTVIERTMEGKPRWHAIGLVEGLILVVVVHTYRDAGAFVRIIFPKNCCILLQHADRARLKFYNKKDSYLLPQRTTNVQKVTVIGGAGYIGSVLVPTLLREGYAVTVLDNFSLGQSSLLDVCLNGNFEILRGDCRDEGMVKKAIAGADFIIPLAAIVGAPACKSDPVATRSINLDAIRMLLTLRSKDQCIVSPCTNSGYGIGEKGIFCTEDTPLRPISLYGVTKVEAEKAILDAGNGISLRLATVFGASPRMRIDLLVNDFVYRAHSDKFLVIFEGHFKRNYIHIRDVAKAFLHAIRNFQALKDQPYNVGLSDANISKLELCAKIKQYLSDFYYVEAEIGQDPDKRDYVVSNEKIERTGYKPDVTLDLGIQELIKVYTILRVKQFGNV